MKHRKSLILVLALMIAVLVACGGGGKDSVKSIWPDVPIPEEAKGTAIKLPLPLRLLIQTAMRASDQGSGVNADEFDFVGYTTPQTPEQVAEFYSEDRMSAAGWEVAEGLSCTATTDSDSGFGGGFCAFGKHDGDELNVVFIAIAKNDDSNDTNIYFVRFGGKDTE